MGKKSDSGRAFDACALRTVFSPGTERTIFVFAKINKRYPCECPTPLEKMNGETRTRQAR
jgi:hypothetical protein